METKKKLPKEVKQVQKHPTLKINRKKVRTISYSQFAQYDKCPHRWYLGYVKKLRKYEPTIHTVFGTSIHETLQHWLEVMYNISGKQANEIDLEKYLLDRMKLNYQKERKRHRQDFSTSIELQNFWLEGCSILKFLKNKKSLYFTLKKVFLVGIEIPLVHPLKEGVLFEGYIDLVFYDARTDEYEIIDIKTSTKGWTKWDKTDDNKTSQLLLYKQYFAEQFNVSVDKINVKYFIVKRQVPKDPEFASMARRVQEFKPTAGKVKMNRIHNKMQEFLNNAFDEQGKRIDKVYMTNPSKSNCMFCDFKNNKSLCPDAVLE